LPSKVPRVLHARVHSLRAHRAVDVRGVAGEKHAGLAVAMRLPVMQAEMGQPRGVAKTNEAARRPVDAALEVTELELASCERLLVPRSMPGRLCAGRSRADG